MGRGHGLLIWWLCCVLALPAVAGQTATYVVRRGDNLTLIGHRLGVTVDALRRANGLGSDLIHIGQRLRVQNPLAGLDAGDPTWLCPLREPGEILRGFGPYASGGVLMPSTGVDVACRRSAAVRAPATGVVRHLGQVEGFGLVVIIEHAAGRATVLAPLRNPRVEVGQAVLRGDLLGEAGEPPVAGPDYLHIELRRQNKAIDPAPLLP